jgi:uncharacterized repeat protein (TIGR01451 family)
MKTKIVVLTIVCAALVNSLAAQVIRPFTQRYYNASVRGNVVYIANSIIKTNGVGTGTPGTGEIPPAGSSSNNGSYAVYIDVDNPTATTISPYNSTWKYLDNNTRPANWETVAYNDAAWSSGNGKFGYNDGQTTCMTSGCTPICAPSSGCIKYITTLFRRVINIPSTAAYASIQLNIQRNDGIVVYVNGTQVGVDNMPAGPYTNATFASSDIATGAAENVTLTIPISSFVNGNNTIAVEMHLQKTKATELGFDMEVVGVPVDNSGTFSSSTADLSLSSCSQVLFAGLYWGAGQGAGGSNTAWITGETTCKLKIPGASSYTTITSTQNDYHNNTLIPGYVHTGYKCFADITSLINTSNPNGTYTVANVLGAAGINDAYGGWTIVVAYSNSTLPLRNIAVYDGNAAIKGGNAPVDINLSGFLTPPSGTVTCELGAVVYDGDRVSTDSFAFKQNGAASFYSMATTTIPLNGTNDAWNSKISYKGSIVTTRNPAFNNTLGYDASIFDLPNVGNAQLGNNKTSATVRFASPSENYLVQVLTTSISQYNPSFTLDKSSTDLNGGSLTTGDILRYQISYNNVGDDAAISSMIYDNIPAGTSYVPGSLKINSTSKTDASGDDQAEYDATNNRVVFRLGTGANAASGGTLSSGTSGNIQFDVVVASSCRVTSCISSISNSGKINYSGQSSSQSLYDSSGVTSSGCFSIGPDVKGITPSCYTPGDTSIVNSCPATSVMLPYAKYAGYTFYSAMPFTSGNIYNYLTAVTTSHTYYAYFNSGTGCSDTIQINVYINPCPDIDDDNDGIPDYVEINIPAALLDADGDGIPNWKDTDYAGFVDNNGDGFNDNFDPAADSDNDGTPNFLDHDFPGFVDSNGDGVNDNMDKDLDGIPNNFDLDSDNDGIPDTVESFGADNDGDGRIDNYTDTDNDGFSQNVDANNTGISGSGNGLGAVDTDGDGIPNYLDTDSDNDGIPDVIEVYGTDANNDGKIDGYTDTDGDGLSDNVDGDVGNDGIIENGAAALLKTGPEVGSTGRCGVWPNKNMDADSKANPYDLDSDGDGIVDVVEAGFTDSNYDGQIDGSVNSKGWNTTIAALGSLSLPNTDGVGRANLYDIDSDDDGIPDNVEGLPTSNYVLPSASDSDGDGLDNSYDTISGFGGKGINPVDTDGDTIPDYLDSDTDGDFLPDIIEGNDFNFNNVRDDLVTLTGIDTDGDGLDDRFDANNSSAEGTSAYMGNSGTTSGDVTPGSITVVQKSFPSNGDRDWRYIQFVLDLHFITFKANLQNKNAALNWTVFSAQQVDHFVVERSIDGIHFSAIQNIAANLRLNQNENFNTPDDLAGVNSAMVYYRVQAFGTNGRVNSSNVIALRLIGTTTVLQIAPNPVKDHLQIMLSSNIKTIAECSIADANGNILMRFTENISAGTNTFSYHKVNELANGIYYLHLKLGDKLLSEKFILLK